MHPRGEDGDELFFLQSESTAYDRRSFLRQEVSDAVRDDPNPRTPVPNTYKIRYLSSCDGNHCFDRRRQSCEHHAFMSPTRQVGRLVLRGYVWHASDPCDSFCYGLSRETLADDEVVGSATDDECAHEPAKVDAAVHFGEPHRNVLLSEVFVKRPGAEQCEDERCESALTQPRNQDRPLTLRAADAKGCGNEENSQRQAFTVDASDVPATVALVRRGRAFRLRTRLRTLAKAALIPKADAICDRTPQSRRTSFTPRGSRTRCAAFFQGGHDDILLRIVAE